MTAIVLLALLGLDAPVQAVMDAVSEHDCPKVFGMLTPSFQQAVPAEKWPGFCNNIGGLKDIERTADKEGWQHYKARGAKRTFDVALHLDDSGRIAGLRVNTWIEPDTAKSLDEKLAHAGARYHVPALAALVMKDGKITQQGVWGVRKLGDKTPATTSDRWHLGSDTKAMTATLAALLVAEGKLSWTSTIGSVLGEWKDIDPRYAGVTLEELLAHRGGMPKDTPKPIHEALWAAADQMRGRSDAVHAVLAMEPSRIGAYQYSNMGYVTAGVMLEKVTGQTWEALMSARVFKPLGMTSCGYGAPASPHKIDQPWAHREQGNALVPVEPGRASDNPPGVGPAGTVSCSLGDWAKFVHEHVRGERGERTVLKLSSATYRKLHSPVGGGDYALGWSTQGYGTKSVVLSHEGSNTMFVALVQAVSDPDLIVLVATNAASQDAHDAVADVRSYLTATK